MKSTKKKKKTKLQKTLEEGDLLFNLVLSVWFLILCLIFGGVLKMLLPYKIALVVFYALISAFSINLVFKIADIYMVYTKESIDVKIQRELEAKRKLKRMPS